MSAPGKPVKGADWREPSHPKHVVAACTYCDEVSSEHIGTAMDPNRRGARLREVRRKMRDHIEHSHPETLEVPRG